MTSEPGDPPPSAPSPSLAAPRFAAPLAVGEQALFALANLAPQILLARSVPRDAFGAYAVASTFLLVAAIAHQTCLLEPMIVFGGGRLKDALTRYHARLRARWSAIISLGLAATGLVLAALATSLGSAEAGRALAALALATPAVLHLWLLRRMAFALGRIDLSAAATAVYATTVLLACAALLLAGRFGVMGAVLATGVAAVLACAFLRFHLRWPPAGAPPPRGLLRLHLVYGRPALVAEAAAWALTNGPALTVPLWLGLGAAAELRALSLLYMPLLQIAAVASLLLLRRDATRPERADGGGAAARLGAGAAAYALGAVLAGPTLAPRLLGPDYQLDAPILAAAGAGTICLVAAQGFLATLRARERPGAVLAAHLAGLALLLAIMPLAAPGGILGIVAAQAIAAAGLLVAARLALGRATRGAAPDRTTIRAGAAPPDIATGARP